MFGGGCEAASCASATMAAQSIASPASTSASLLPLSLATSAATRINAIGSNCAISLKMAIAPVALDISFPPMLFRACQCRGGRYGKQRSNVRKNALRAFNYNFQYLLALRVFDSQDSVV